MSFLLRGTSSRLVAAALSSLASGIVGAAEPEGPASAYYWFSHWLSVGDLDAAADQFAERAIVIVAPSCPPEDPCVGRAAIRRRYLAWIAGHADARPLIDQRLDGTTMRAHDKHSYHTAVADGTDWREARYAFELRDGRIESLTFGRGGSEATATMANAARSTRR